MTEAHEIRRILPHRYPMLLLDRVTELVPGERLTALKMVTCNEPWYAAATAAEGDAADAYPPVLLVESWCQAAGVLAAWQRPNPDVLAGRVMLFGSMSDVRLHRPALPGDVLEHHVRLLRSLQDAAIFEGETVAAGSLVLEVGRVVMALRDAAALHDGDGAGAASRKEAT